MEVAGLSVYQRRAGAAVSVHPGLGVGSAGGHDADPGRMGADFNMREVI